MKKTETVWAFDLGKGSIGEAVRQGPKFLHKASLRIPAGLLGKKEGRAKRPVQELRLLSGSSCDLRSLAACRT